MTFLFLSLLVLLFCSKTLSEKKVHSGINFLTCGLKQNLLKIIIFNNIGLEDEERLKDQGGRKE